MKEGKSTMTDFEMIEFLKFAFCYGTSCQHCMLDNLPGNTCGNKIKNVLCRIPGIIIHKIKKESKRMKKEAIKNGFKTHETVVGSEKVCKMFLGWAE